MHRLGHIGVALLAALPLGTGLVCLGESRLATLGFLLAVAMSSVPDFDQELPIQHRGPTHTVWFVAGATVVAGIAGWALAGGSSTVGFVTATATGLSLLSHLLADSITPMGIRPYLPLSEKEYCFDIVPAANKRANRLLFGAGTVSVFIWYSATV